MMKEHIKITEGCVIQSFITLPNGTMVCQSQEFKAGDHVEYEDGQGNVITIDTTKEVYCDFLMAQPKQIGTDGLKFTCPACGGERLECVMDGSHTCEVTYLNESGDFDYGEYQSNADLARWQCLKCGGFLTNDGQYGVSTRHGEDEPIIHNDEVVEWIKKHCKQE